MKTVLDKAIDFLTEEDEDDDGGIDLDTDDGGFWDDEEGLSLQVHCEPVVEILIATDEFDEVYILQDDIGGATIEITMDPGGKARREYSFGIYKFDDKFVVEGKDADNYGPMSLDSATEFDSYEQCALVIRHYVFNKESKAKRKA